MATMENCCGHFFGQQRESGEFGTDTICDNVDQIKLAM
jgi:hypothetical protein